MAISTRPPSGMRDFLPEELAKRNHVINTIKRVYQNYGFVQLETPSIENLTTLLGKYGDEGDQLVFKILHRRDKLARALANAEVSEKDLADMGLRYDLTVPLARVIAHYPELPRFFKRYQLQPVWRADRPGKGRFREFMQCDVDIVGTESLLAEADVCSAVAEVFTALGLNDFKIHINHRQLLKCIIKAAGLKIEQEATTLVAVDKLDKIGLDGVKKELEQRSVKPEQIGRLLKLITRPENSDVPTELERLSNELAEIDKAQKHLEQLEQLCQLLNSTAAAGKFIIDPSLARGLGYYTGPIFEIRSDKLSGSIGGGGRYDNLIGMFKGSQIPAVGFSIGFERLIMILDQQGLFSELSSGPEVLICHFKDVNDATVLALANSFRKNQIKTEIFPETPKPGKQISYAKSINAKWVAIIGASEAEAKKVTIKNLASGNQKTLSWQEAAKLIKN